jgi:hypothetical protein
LSWGKCLSASALIDSARLAVCKCIVRGKAAVLAAHRSGHLAADFPADNVATGKDVRHVRAQEFIDADLTFAANVPRTIFTDPQIATVGMTEQEAISAGHDCWCNSVPMSLVPRAGAIRDTRGLIQMVADARTEDPAKLSCCAE